MMAMIVSAKMSPSTRAGPGGSLAKIFAANIRRPSAGAVLRYPNTRRESDSIRSPSSLGARLLKLQQLFSGLQRQLGRKAKRNKRGQDADHRTRRQPQRRRGAVVQQLRQAERDCRREGAKESVGETQNDRVARAAHFVRHDFGHQRD